VSNAEKGEGGRGKRGRMKGGKGGTGEEGKRTIAAVSTIGVESPYVHNIINEGKRMDHDDQDLHKEGTQQPRQNERLHTHTHNTQAPPEHTPFEFLARVLMRNDRCTSDIRRDVWCGYFTCISI